SKPARIEAHDAAEERTVRYTSPVRTVHRLHGSGITANQTIVEGACARAPTAIRTIALCGHSISSQCAVVKNAAVRPATAQGPGVVRQQTSKQLTPGYSAPIRR